MPALEKYQRLQKKSMIHNSKETAKSLPLKFDPVYHALYKLFLVGGIRQPDYE